MHHPLFLLVGLLIALGVSAESTCRSTIPIHKVVAEGIIPISDVQGAPLIRGSVYTTKDCQVDVRRPTGRELDMNRTRLSQRGADGDSCQVKIINGVSTIDSYQAIVLESNGWPLNEARFDFNDVDASTLGWKEAGAAFGLRNGTMVRPNISLSDGSVLSKRSFDIPGESAIVANLGTAKISSIPGFLYTRSEVVNCHVGIGSERCRASVSFSSPIDTIVILYMVASRGSVLSKSSASLSQLNTACGCRCRKPGTGNRSITEPVPGLPGQCTRKQVPNYVPECDRLGEEWCKIEPRSHYEVTGNTLPNGNLQCKESIENVSVIQRAFSPDPNFSALS